jgi:hypothetical protein
MAVNLNTMARNITLQEGMKKSVSIAQVKEILKLTLRSLKTMSVAELMQLLARVQ